MQAPEGKVLVLDQAEAYERHIARTATPPPPPPPPAGLRPEDGAWSYGPGTWTWTSGSAGRRQGADAPGPGVPHPPPVSTWTEEDAGPMLPTHHKVLGRNNVGLKYEHLFPEIPTFKGYHMSYLVPYESSFPHMGRVLGEAGCHAMG
eukprot:3279158-Alexandrium_andersonii.AAC.1